MDEQVRKCGMCVYNEMLFTIKKKGNPAFATTQIDREHDANSEKERQILYDFTSMWNLKKKNSVS